MLGDILVINAGDQMPVDGVIVDGGKLEVDRRADRQSTPSIKPGDQVLSGSFCIQARRWLEPPKVGEQSFANRTSKNARQFKLERTPLQRDVNPSAAHPAGGGLLRYPARAGAVGTQPCVDLWLQTLAVITGSISAGLLVFITLNFSWGAVRIGQQGGLVQQINAVESLSNVTVLCTDKTSTLTNKIRYHDAPPVGIDTESHWSNVYAFAASATSTNKTT